MEHISIYLAGNIQKDHENKSQIYWTEEDRDFLRNELAPKDISFLNPALRTDDLSDQLSVFGRDMTQVYCSDLVFVDARERRGLGVGAEMMWAKMNRIPLLILAPINSHYRKQEVKLLGARVENWVHPFVESLSDRIVANLEQAVVWIDALMNGKVQDIKGPEFIKIAMQHYKHHQYENDHPMNELATNNGILKARIEGISSLLSPI